MKCSKIQRLCYDLADGRLTEAVAREVQHHVEQCTDCRVAQQRAARLQQLLGVKRHERPSPEYFDGFLHQFQRRLQAEQARLSFWQRIVAPLTIEPSYVWRYGFAGAMGLLMTANMLWPVTGSVAGTARPTLAVSTALLGLADLPASHSTPRSIAAMLPHNTAAPASDDSVAVFSASARTDVSTPRYVLDRITVTPASYEVPNVRF